MKKAALRVAGAVFAILARGVPGGERAAIWDLPVPEGFHVAGTCEEAYRALEAFSAECDPAGRGVRFVVDAELAERSVAFIANNQCDGKPVTLADAALFLGECVRGRFVPVGDAGLVGWHGEPMAAAATFLMVCRDADSGEAVRGARPRAVLPGLVAVSGETGIREGVALCMVAHMASRTRVEGVFVERTEPEALEVVIEAEGYEPATVEVPGKPQTAWTGVPIVAVEMRRAENGTTGTSESGSR